MVMLMEECSAILQNKLPPKLKDTESFTIPCTLGNSYFEKALCDLDASINLMPCSIFKKLDQLRSLFNWRIGPLSIQEV